MSLTWSEYRYLLMENNLPLLVYAADQIKYYSTRSQQMAIRILKRTPVKGHFGVSFFNSCLYISFVFN